MYVYDMMPLMCQTLGAFDTFYNFDAYDDFDVFDDFDEFEDFEDYVKLMTDGLKILI